MTDKADGETPIIGHGGDSAGETVAAAEENAAARNGQSRIDSLFRCFLRLAPLIDRPISDPDLRSVVSVGGSGMTVTQFLAGLRRLGTSGSVVPLRPAELGRWPVPYVIVGWTAGDSRIVTEVGQDALTVFNPLTARTEAVEIDDTTKLGGQIILVRPISKLSGKMDWRSLLRGKIKRVLWQLILASLLINLFALTMPLFIMTVYNRVIGHRALDTLEILAIGMIGVVLFDGILRVVRGYVSSQTGARVDALLSGEVIHRFLRLPLDKLEAVPSGVWQERLRRLDVVRGFFTGQMPLAIGDFAFVGLFIAILFYLHTTIGLIALGVVPLFVGMSAAFHRTHRRLIADSFEAQSAKNSAFNETVNNLVTVKSSMMESELEKRWGDRVALSAYASYKGNSLASGVATAGYVLQQLTSLLLVFVGVHLVLAGELSIGGLIAANILAMRAIAPLRQTAAIWAQVREVRDALSRLSEILEEEPEVELGQHAPISRVKGHISVRGLTFRYPEMREPVLRGVDYEFEPGKIYAVIGPSGSGKSTLGKLMLGLYRPESGAVLIDDVDLDHISRPTLRRQIGYAPQNPQLFAGTVRDNIALGISMKDHERVVAAARIVGAHDFIKKLPKGYDTILQEGGGGLSEGQRQAICLARMVYRNAPIFILDEPTSFLDTSIETVFLGNLRRMAKDRTVILISHQESTIAVADEVIKICDGRMVRLQSEVTTITEYLKLHEESRRRDGVIR